MATKIKATDGIAVIAKDKIPPKVEAVRQKFLMLSLSGGAAEAGTGNTFWEELGCAGYNPELSLLEGVLTIKRATGYSGGLCTDGSTEYVRFFVDYNDGAGYQDAGVATVQVHDISDADPGPQHPLRYVVQLPLDADAKRKVCKTPVLPKLRAVLSWNTPPSTNPNDPPVFGNRVDTLIQLKPKLGLKFEQALDLGIFAKEFAPQLPLSTFVKLKPQVTDFAGLADIYTKAKAAPRLAFAALKSQAVSLQQSPKLAASALKLSEKIFVELSELLAASSANTEYEELTCVGLNPARDTLGAIVRVKKSVGYSGGLCDQGSQEYVAFWADWNNNGVFEYLGTTNVEVHDLTHAQPIDYAVQLPTTKILEHLKKCTQVNVVKIRAVLSWNTAPSTTDPNDLNAWGNRRDVLVQLRPGKASTGISHHIWDVGSVDLSNISPVSGLAFPGVADPGNNRPFGGWIRVGGKIHNAPAGGVHYRLRVRPAGGTYQPVLGTQTLELMYPPWHPLYPKQFVAVTADANGWRVYQEDLAGQIYERTALLVSWNSGSEQGPYDLQFQWTADDPNDPGATITSEVIRVEVNNIGFTVNPDPDPAIDPAYSVDITILGGACKLYPLGTNLNTLIDGRVRVIHDYFRQYYLDLQPDSMTGLEPTVIATGTNARAHNAPGDNGDSGLGLSGRWTINGTLPACGYTVMLHATDRTILNSAPGHGYGFYVTKAVGFAVF